MDDTEFETVEDSSLYTMCSKPVRLQQLEEILIPLEDKSISPSTGVSNSSNTSIENESSLLAPEGESIQLREVKQPVPMLYSDNEDEDSDDTFYESGEMSKTDDKCFKNVVFNILQNYSGQDSILGYPKNSVACDCIPDEIKYELNLPEAENLKNETPHPVEEVDSIDVLEEWCDALEKLTLSKPDYGYKVDSNENSSENRGNCKESTTEESTDDTDQQPIYAGSRITLGAALLLIQLFGMKYHIPCESMIHLLSVICLLLPHGHSIPNTLNDFRKKFMNLKNQIVFHYFCCNCLTYLKSKEVKQCPNRLCLKDLTSVKSSISYFLEIPVIGQLQTLFMRPKFYRDIQHRFKSEKAKKEC